MLDGQEISDIATIGSWWDNNAIVISVGNKRYRMNVNIILQMVNEFVFKIKEKRVHTWIVEDILKDELEGR